MIYMYNVVCRREASRTRDKKMYKNNKSCSCDNVIYKTIIMYYTRSFL